MQPQYSLSANCEKWSGYLASDDPQYPVDWLPPETANGQSTSNRTPDPSAERIDSSILRPPIEGSSRTATLGSKSRLLKPDCLRRYPTCEDGVAAEESKVDL